MAMNNGVWYEGVANNAQPQAAQVKPSGGGVWNSTERDTRDANIVSWDATPHPTGSINPYSAQKDPRGTMADILRGQWGEFETTTVPIIRQLEGMTTYNGNAGVVDALKTEARMNAKASFGSILPDAQRQSQSYGMALNPTTAGALERSAKLGEAAASVDGVNRANQYQRDLNRQIVSGSNLATAATK